MSRLIRLYPPRWRARYETEFRALLEEQRLDLTDRLNILWGALVAWLNPRYGYSVYRSALWLSLVAAITILLAAGVGVLHGTPAEASPRFPVTLSLGPDNEVETLQFVVSDVQRTIPHLILSVDARRSWLLTGVITERSSVAGRLTGVTVPETERSTWRHAWDFGRVQPNQSVRLTIDFHIVRPNAFAYSIVGYGALAANGRPDTTARLTNAAPPDATVINFGTVGPSRYRFRLPGEPGCDSTAASGYRLCSVGDSGSDFLRFDFRNAGRPVPHFVLQVDSRHSWSPDGVTASVRNNGIPRLLVPRIRSAHRFIYTVDFGRLPHGAYLDVHLARVATGQARLTDEVRAFADLTSSGQPDPKSLIFKGWNLF